MELTDRQLTGRIVRLHDVGKAVEEVKLPEGRGIVCITNEDFPFYDNVVQYDGQPGLAVFGPDAESVEEYIGQIKIYVSEVAQISEDPETVDSYNYKDGKVEYYFRNPEHVFTTTVTMQRHSFSPINDLRVKAWEREGKLHIETSTQWPMRLKKELAEFLKIEVSSVILHSMPYHDRYDEYLNAPIQAAKIVAAATKKTGKLCELKLSPMSWQPEIQINYSSAMDKSGHCSAVKVEAKVDMGAIPSITDEYLRSLVAGLVPVYKLSALEINTTAYKSPNPPACFYSDLGYSIGLAACENHFNKVAKKLMIKPSEWRKTNVFKSAVSEKFRKSSQFAAVKQSVISCCEDSWFDRQYSVNIQEHLYRNGVNPFIKYSRGIGLACGEGVQGFSNLYKGLSNYSLTVTVSKENKVNITCGIIPDAFLGKIITNIVEKHLGISEENVEFEDINKGGADFGPSVLSRKIRYIPALVEKCCKLIARRKTRPTSVTLTSMDDKKDYMYQSDTSGSLVLALHIDEVMLVPVVDHICVRAKMGKIYDMVRLHRMIRQAIGSTIKEICPCTPNTFDIDVEVQEDENFPVGSMASLVRGLTIAAFTSALSQSLGHQVKDIPVYDSDIMGILDSHPADESDNKEKEDEEHES